MKDWMRCEKYVILWMDELIIEIRKLTTTWWLTTVLFNLVGKQSKKNQIIKKRRSFSVDKKCDLLLS